MKKMSLLVLSMAIALSAAFVPVDRAKTVAENQYKQYCADASTKSANVVRVVDHKYEGETTWYAFEFEKGFVIVSADDSVRPILGYSDHGSIPSEQKWNHGGQNFKEWFGYYDKQIALVRKNNIVDKTGAQSWKDIENNVFSSSKAGVVVDRLVNVLYDQVWPWNDDCPVKGDDGAYTYVGCVATAMAIITRYHKWPDVGVGSASYSWNNDVTNITLAATFSSHTWNYALMPEAPVIEYGLYPVYWESGITQAEVDELALQSYWMGLSVNMDYGDDADGGSGAYMTNVSPAYVDHWKGASTYATMATPPAGGVDAQYATIKAQLDAKRPWQWAGGVHSFVLDGYRDDYWYHFNWGWGGSYDGWFHRSSLVPDGALAGGGDGDYTAGQSGNTYIPNTNPFTAWPATTVSGSVSGDDITVNWTAQTGAVNYEVYRTIGKEATPTLVTTVTGTSYVAADQSANEYNFSVMVNYASGKSHMSNAYSATIVASATFPVARSVTGVANGRTSIDLSWTEPFVGVLNAYVDFDAAEAMPAGWLDKTSYSPNTGSVWTLDPNDWVFVAAGSNFSNWFYQSRIDGNILLTSAAATETLWVFSPAYTFNSNHSVKWWMRFRYTDDTGVLVPQRPIFEWRAYSGTFTETKRETNIVSTLLGTYNGSTYPENIWEREESLSLASLNGLTTRLAIRVAVNTNDLYTLAFDKITIGSTSGGGDQPNGYQVFRGGTQIGTVGSGTTYTYSDTGFADGNNTYYVKATYPTGTSIASNHKTVWIDANPKPSDLIGNVSPDTSANLSWYLPYHNRPKWYMHMDPNFGISTSGLDDPTAPVQQKRVVFKATDLGYYYPITLDSIAAIFYDWDEGDWGGVNKFKFRILTGGTGGYTNIVYESAEITAIHNTLMKHKLPTPMVLSETFNIEVMNTAVSDFPANLSGFGADPTNTHSYFMYDPGTGPVYTYGITGGGNWYEWAFQAYITSSTPSKSNTGWVSSAVVDPKIGKEAVNNRTIPTPYKGKGLDYYKVYRNNSYLGQTTSLGYTDSAVPADGDYTYKVTAYYASPVGESAPTNEVTLYVKGGGPIIPGVPTPITTSLVSGNVRFDWPDAADATSYDVYSSVTPYGTFAFLANVAVSEYTYTPTATKMFFYFVSKNATKESPKTIEIARPVSR